VGAAIALNGRQRLAWLRLIRSENVGPATFRSLVNHFGSAERALAALPDLARRGGARGRLRLAGEAEVEREMQAAERLGARFVALGEADYPAWLALTDAPPPLLATLGDGAALRRPAIAVVGARNASAAGRRMASLLARDLGAAGYAIASGLARGIDAAAHEAALGTGTVAVFAGGLDRLYPPENEGLFRAILESGGAAVSEMPFGWEPKARDFPRRNRIIAGMSLATIVVEAGLRSGSLITARLALEQGREVMAVPGSPLDPRAEGANHLLKQGARLVTGAADVLDGIGAEAARAPSTSLFEPAPPIARAEPADAERRRIMEALGPSPAEIDDVARFSGVATRMVQVVLLELELAGRLERHAGNRVSLVG